jgi:hypothetical protein
LLGALEVELGFKGKVQMEQEARARQPLPELLEAMEVPQERYSLVAVVTAGS